MIGLEDHISPMKCLPMSWSDISEKYRWQFKRKTQNAVLFIDCTLQSVIGLDPHLSQRNVVDFFSQLIDKGVAIHLKSHQGHQQNTFSGTELENKVEILPTFYPVELIMDYYQEVYGINSAALRYPIKGKKLALVKLLVFTSQERESILNNTFRINVGTEINNIELLESPIHQA